MSYTRIASATIVTCDAAGTVIEDGDVWFRDGRIVSVGPAGSWSPPEGSEVTTVPGEGQVAMPGLANCHTHSYAAFLKGTVDNDPLDVFMIGAILGAGERTPHEVYLSAKVQALEMLLTGSTACLDHFSHRPRHDPEALDAVCRAYADAGVRAAVAPMFSDRPFVETVPLAGELSEEEKARLPGAPQPIEPYFEIMDGAVRRWRDHPRVDVMLGVDSPQRCSQALLERAGAFCAEHQVGNHTHLLEAKTQWAMAEGRDPRGFVAYLKDLGLAGPRSSFAHFVWGTEEDIRQAAESGVHIAHNPASNLVLGSGIQPLLKLIEAGVNVAFGSDGLNVGHMSMFEKLRLAALLPRVTETDPDRWLTAGSALRMATVNGAALLGRGGEAGEIAAGQLADIVLLDGRSVALSPRGALAPQIVFYETGASVRDVFVEGERVLEGGAPTRFDGAATLAEAHEAAARIARDSREALERAAALRPGLVAMVRRVLEGGAGPCRIATLT